MTKSARTAASSAGGNYKAFRPEAPVGYAWNAIYLKVYDVAQTTVFRCGSRLFGCTLVSPLCDEKLPNSEHQIPIAKPHLPEQ